MARSKQREKQKKARDLIYKALCEYYESEPDIPEFQDNRIPFGKYHEELTRRGIDAGVTALVLINNMSGGSVDNVDLYQLLQRYLLNKDDRKQINLIISKI